MTLIEFFEKDAVENICASLVYAPERVIFISDKQHPMQKLAQNYSTVLSGRGINTEIKCLSVNKNKLNEVVTLLASIADKYDDCIFDITGGEDTMLVALGIIMERYGSKRIRLFRYNINSSSVMAVGISGGTELKRACLSVEENIRIYGGDIVYRSTKGNATATWSMDADFERDIMLLWDVCRENIRLWNTQTTMLATAESLREHDENSLKTKAPISKIMERMGSASWDSIFVHSIFSELRHAGLITAFSGEDSVFSIVYKNEQVKRCLLKSGQVLEMMIYTAALKADDRNGTKVYNDVMTGVFIDWDGKVHRGSGGFDTENEIDVMMMHGLIPVFVSCKNGRVPIDELYKLSAVATRFGGKYAKKVLVAPLLDIERGMSTEYIMQRAADMDIRVIGNIQQLAEPVLDKTIRSFWSE